MLDARPRNKNAWSRWKATTTYGDFNCSLLDLFYVWLSTSKCSWIPPLARLSKELWSIVLRFLTAQWINQIASSLIIRWKLNWLPLFTLASLQLCPCPQPWKCLLHKNPPCLAFPVPNRQPHHHKRSSGSLPLLVYEIKIRCNRV